MNPFNPLTEYKKFREYFWTGILGFKPEQEFESPYAESKCYKCASKDIERIPASSWTSKHRCNSCGYFTFIIHADFMSGALSENVAIDKKDFDL